MSQSVAPSPLGTYIAGIASETPVESGVVLRFLLQEEAQRLLPEEKVFQCLRRLAPMQPRMGEKSPVYDQVEVSYRADINHAAYRNLVVCDRLWICPVCASRISEIRRRAITKAINVSGLHACLVTFTLQHRKHTPLKTTLDTLLTAYRKLKSGRWWADHIAGYGWVGDIRALEFTYGENGWHPHIHAIMLFSTFLGRNDLTTMENALKDRFGAVLRTSGGYANYKNGVTVKDDDEFTRDYISKFGRMPDKKELKGWTISHELTSANRKLPKTKEGATPWLLLYRSLQGDETARALFCEYANQTKGRNQLVWSRGLRARLGMDEIESTFEVEESAARVLLTIDKYWWSEICHNHLRGKLLQAIKDNHGDFDAITAWINVQLGYEKEIEK